MFESPFDFYSMLDIVSLLIAIVALILARKALNQAAGLRARLASIETASPAAPPPAPLPGRSGPASCGRPPRERDRAGS